MSTSSRRSPSADTPCRAARPYLRVPVDLIVAFAERPAVVGIYAGIARLNAIYKRGIALSRADLARWCDAERDALAGCIKRGVDDLEDGGWLVVDRPGRKLSLLAGWGKGNDGVARPLRFDRPDRGRPKGLRFVTLPLDLFDLALGRLTPDTHDAATVERYFDRPLLDFADIGTYALRQLAQGPATPRLMCLALVPDAERVDPQALDDLPTLAALLERATAGTLVTCDDAGTAIPVALTPAGTARMRRLAARAPTDSDAQDGSVGDPSNTCTGSVDGSGDSTTQYAPECADSHQQSDVGAAWDRHGTNQETKRDPPAEDSHGAHTQAAGRCMRSGDSDQATPNRTRDEQPIENLPTPPPESSAGCEENHISVLDPLVLAWHRALNPDRVVPDAEVFALLDLQERYGRDALRRWMFRASNARKTFVLPGYYEACAAADAFAAIGRGRRTQGRVGMDLPPQTQPTAEPPPRPRLQRVAAPPAQSSCPLDPEHTALIAAIAERSGRAIRQPALLAAVPVELLASWRDIAGHPGLLARWDDPIGWLISEVTKGHTPPSLDELARWAERAGIHWADPRLAAFRPATNAESAPPSLDVLPSKSAPDARSDGGETVSKSFMIAPSDPAALWHDVCQSLAQMDHSARTCLRNTRLVKLTADLAVIGVPDAATKSAIESRHSGAIRALLRECLGREAAVRLVIGPAAGSPESHPPAWIDTAIWQRLDSGLRATLAGSSLTPDGGLDVRADAYDTICAHWRSEVAALLERAQVRATS